MSTIFRYYREYTKGDEEGYFNQELFWTRITISDEDLNYFLKPYIEVDTLDYGITPSTEFTGTVDELKVLFDERYSKLNKEIEEKINE